MVVINQNLNLLLSFMLSLSNINCNLTMSDDDIHIISSTPTSPVSSSHLNVSPSGSSISLLNLKMIQMRLMPMNMVMIVWIWYQKYWVFDTIHSIWWISTIFVNEVWYERLFIWCLSLHFSLIYSFNCTLYVWTCIIYDNLLTFSVYVKQFFLVMKITYHDCFSFQLAYVCKNLLFSNFMKRNYAYDWK